jgi:hypothetical protein
MRLLTLVFAMAFAATAPRGVEAQRGPDLVASGIAAYRALEYDAAAPLFQLALRQSSLPDSVRAEAGGYLGATQLFRGRTDSAALVWRETLMIDPRYRPDAMVFPPEVTSAFETVRQVTRAVRIAANDTSITPGRESFVMKLYASSGHDIQVDLAVGGRSPRRLYAGRIGDSLEVRWDGLESDRSLPQADRGEVQVRSIVSGASGRTATLPLELTISRSDTAPWPAPPDESLLLPETARATPPYGGLVTGLILSAAAIALPSMIASDDQGMAARYVVGGALGLTSIVGFALRSRGRRSSSNAAANARLRETWQRDLASTKADNLRRRRDVRLRITTLTSGSTAPGVP